MGVTETRTDAEPEASPAGAAHQAHDTASNYVHLAPDGSTRLIRSGRGAHPNLAGFVIGVARLTRNAPHGGEFHPDGDELLVVLSGKVQVILSEGEQCEEVVEVSEGQSFLVPRATWHRVHLLQPAIVVHITPGPNSRHRRPISAAGRSQ